MCSRKWRPHIIAAVIFSVGLLGVIINISTLNAARAQQTSLWYSIPLCKQGTNTSLYVTRDLKANDVLDSVCPTDTQLTTLALAGNPVYNQPQPVTVEVPLNEFEPNLEYIAFTMRTDGTKLFASDMTGITGEQPELRIQSIKFDARSSDDPATTTTGSRRRLLKGGGGGGGYGGSSYSSASYVSRSGTYNSWGSGPVIRRGHTRTGSTVVAAAVYTNVYSPVPIRGSRASTTGAYGTSAYTSQCASQTGCDLSLPSGMTKDEWDKTKFRAQDKTVGSLAVTVTGSLYYAPVSTTAAYPLLFIGFVTGDDIPGVGTATLLLFLFFVLMCCGTGGALMFPWNKHRQFDFCVKGASQYQAVSVGPEVHVDTGIRSAAAVVDPMPVPPPPPTAISMPYYQRNGSHRSVQEIVGVYSTIDVYSNDVAYLTGLERLPQLQILNVGNNDITSFVGVSSMSLLSLNVDDNDLTTLTGVEGARSLQQLSVANNSISGLGMTGPPMLTMQYLNIRDNDLSSMLGINFMPNLVYLDAANNNLATVAGLERLQQLECVDLSQNDITEHLPIVALAMLPKLRWVNIKGNNMRAGQVQEIRDAFEAKVAAGTCKLLS